MCSSAPMEVVRTNYSFLLNALSLIQTDAIVIDIEYESAREGEGIWGKKQHQIYTSTEQALQTRQSRKASI